MRFATAMAAILLFSGAAVAHPGGHPHGDQHYGGWHGHHWHGWWGPHGHWVRCDDGPTGWCWVG